MTSKRARTSPIERAMGPTPPIQPNAPAPEGKWPVAGTRPGVGIAEKNGSGGSQAGDERSVGGREVIFGKKRTGGARPASDVDAAFEGDRNAVKKAQHLAAGDGGFCSAGLGASGASVQMDKG